MPVVDTSFLVDLMRRKSPAIDLYTSYEVQGITLSTTIISTLELYKGAHLSVQTEINLKKVKAILSLFDVLPLNESICEVFGAFSALLQKKGKPIGNFDEVIASIALCHDGILITHDNHFSHLPALEVINYNR